MGSLKLMSWSVLLLILGSNVARAEKITEMAPIPMLAKQIVGISQVESMEGQRPWGQCVGTLFSSQRRILTGAHCVTEMGTINVVSEVFIRIFSSPQKVIRISRDKIHVHPRFVPSDKDNKTKSSDGFDMAVIELPEAIDADPFELVETQIPLETKLASIENCGAVIFRQARDPGGNILLLPFFNPVFRPELADKLNALVESLTGSEKHDVKAVRSAQRMIGGDSGSSVICRDKDGVFSLVGVFRSTSDWDPTVAFVVDIYFDDWLTSHFMEN